MRRHATVGCLATCRPPSGRVYRLSLRFPQTQTSPVIYGRLLIPDSCRDAVLVRFFENEQNRIASGCDTVVEVHSPDLLRRALAETQIFMHLYNYDQR